MLTETRVVVSTLFVVLFLTMIVIDPNIINLSYFGVLLLFAFKCRT